MRVHIEDSSGDGLDEEGAKFVPHVDAVIPQMRFAHKSSGKANPGLPADGIGGVIVWVYVVCK